VPKPSSALRIEHKDPELLKVLQTTLFVVPRFQRTYVWQAQQVLDFFDDLWTGFEERKTWFIGTVIVAKGSKVGRLGPSLNLIDGQQRLTTLFVWLAALREQCRQAGIVDLADHIERTWIKDVSPMAPASGQPRLTLEEGEVNAFFQALVVDGRPTRTPIHGSEERLKFAFDHFSAAIGARLNAAPDPKDLVADLVEWLTESLHAVVAVAPDLASASKVFDLMNSPGLPLSAADLLKSYLFSVTNGAAAPEWAVVAQMFDPLEADAAAIPEIDTFIRHQWFSRHPIPATGRGAPSQRATQDTIRAATTDKASAMRYLGDLRTDAEVYLELARPSRAYWERKSGKGIVDALQDLNLIKIEVFRPLIMAVIRRLPADEQLLFLRSLLSWAFRKKVVTNKLGSGEDERAYFFAAHEVDAGRARTTQEILNVLDIPDDTRFAQAFETLVLEQRQARFVLGRLEDVIEGSGERSTNWDTMTLEHVLSFSATRLGDWPAFTGEQHRSFRNHIGNLTLLRKVPNERVKDGPFASKITAYQASALEITRWIGRQSSWTPDDIAARAQWLAAHAAKAFPLIAA